MLHHYHRTRRCFWIFVCLLLVLIIAPEPHRSLPRTEAATYIVNSLADSDDGSCDATNCSLREAVVAANTAGGADEINFSVTGTITLSKQLTVMDHLSINGSGITLDGNNATRIMIVASPATVVLNELIFQNGSAGTGGGGAIFNWGTLTITGSTFSDNTANSSGAIWNYGTLTITNSTFSGNTAAEYGGAIFNDGILTITNSTFSGNSGAGGAIINRIGTLTITNSTFSGNSGAAGGGGAIRNVSTATISNSIFSGNTTDVGGGAIYNRGIGILTITSNTFSGNQAGINGGAIDNEGTLEITSSTFSGNTTLRSNDATYNFGGGAIRNVGGTLTTTNSTFSSNMAADNGGAIRNVGGTLTISNSTFSGNTTDDTGGTLYNDSIINVTSSIIVGGDCDGTIPDGGNNLSFNAPGCPGMVADPQLGPLQNNGGPTHTMLPALTGPAVDVYPAPCATTTDQRGIARPLGPMCDIGAIEQTVTLAQLLANSACNGPNLEINITAGDGPFNITASAGMNTPVNGVNSGITTINGPEKWDNLTVTETGGDLQSINLGQFKCRTDERPVPLSPAHRAHSTNSFPTFSWTSITGANNYRVFVFDDANPATRGVDIRQNSGGPTTLVLTTPLPDGRLFWRVRGRQNRIWSLWSIRFTLFKDPVAPFGVSTPVPTIDLNPLSGDDSAPTPALTTPAPPNSR